MRAVTTMLDRTRFLFDLCSGSDFDQSLEPGTDLSGSIDIMPLRMQLHVITLTVRIDLDRRLEESSSRAIPVSASGLSVVLCNPGALSGQRSGPVLLGVGQPVRERRRGIVMRANGREVDASFQSGRQERQSVS